MNSWMDRIRISLHSRCFHCSSTVQSAMPIKDITDMKGDYRAIIEQIKNLVREVERSNSLTSQIIRSNSALRRNEVKEVGYEE